MWRSIWSDEADLKKMGRISARNPIEALYNGLKKGGKKLPGYWNGSARKMRSDGKVNGLKWFAESGWQARNHSLFTLAGEVSKKLGIQRAAPTKTVSKTGPKPRANAGAKVASAPEAATMRLAIIGGAGQGRKSWIKLRFGRRQTRYQVLRADKKSITLRTREGMQMTMPWSAVSDKDLSALAEMYKP